MSNRVKKTASGVLTTSAFIRGKRYIDDLVLREKGAEKLYSLADPNWNVVAITNASGTAQERMKYDAVGKITWMNASFGTLSNSTYAWNRTYTGQVLDTESGLMLYRNRYYNTGLGRFVTRDPVGYGGKDGNLYRYVRNRVVLLRDSSGLKLEKTGVKYCKGWQKGAFNSQGVIGGIIGGLIPVHWFIVVDGVGIGKFEKDLNSVGTGEIRFDDLATYPNVPHEGLADGQYYSTCEDILLEKDCYDLDLFKSTVRNYANFSAGIYVVGLYDCREWVFSAVCEGREKSKRREPDYRSFCKCTWEYIDECSAIYTTGGTALR
jgi:RHS repeat-associated protein